MTFSTRLCLFLGVVIVGVLAWQCNLGVDSSAETTRLAVQQFQANDAVPANLQQASLAQNWWPFVWPVLIIVIGIVMFWDDAEPWWSKENENPIV